MWRQTEKGDLSKPSTDAGKHHPNQTQPHLVRNGDHNVAQQREQHTAEYTVLVADWVHEVRRCELDQ